MFVITITVETDRDLEEILAVLGNAEAEGDIENSFDVKVDETTETK